MHVEKKVINKTEIFKLCVQKQSQWKERADEDKCQINAFRDAK